MGTGAGILLIVVGAIRTFAAHVTVAGLDLPVVGWILMLAGVAGLAIVFLARTCHRVPRTVVSERQVYEESTQPAL